MSADHKDAISQCDSILDLLDDLPEAADAFIESVGDKIRSMREWIAEHEHVTDKQQAALDNMEAGAERWAGED